MSYMPVSSKLLAFDSSRHVEVLPNAEYTPVPIAITNAIAATCNHFLRRSLADQRSVNHSRITHLPVQVDNGGPAADGCAVAHDAASGEFHHPIGDA
jgi:hypothetical protein